MAALSVLFIISLIFLLLQLLTLFVNMVTFPVLKHARPKRQAKVSILIPARNEAVNLPETLPRLLAQPAIEILVLDDQSTDATPQILRQYSQDNANLKVRVGQDLPEGWTGKNWACHQLAQQARGDILIFTDADVYWEAGTLDALLAMQEANEANYLSVWPRQLTESLMERITVPVIDLILLGALPYPAVRWLPLGVFSAGNGQLMMWHKDAYESIGGHAAFKGEVLEDVRMGQAAKRAGLRVTLAVGGQLIATRMYRNTHELLAGFSKNILAASGNSRGLLIMAGFINTLTHSLSWALIPLYPWFALVAGLSLVQRLLTNLKTHRSLWEVFLQPLWTIPMWRIIIRALQQGRSVSWKGRSYPPRSLS